MILLIAVTKPLQDLLCVLLIRLFHKYRLKTPLQSRVLLDMLPVFLHSCRSDQLNFSAGERRLQDISRVQRALRASGSDQGVNLIQKKNQLWILGRFLNHALHALLEFTTVLRPGNHPGKIQRQQAIPFQSLRYLI